MFISCLNSIESAKKLCHELNDISPGCLKITPLPLYIFRICISLAEHSILSRDNQQAIFHFKEALKHSPDDINVMTSLARLHIQANNMVECQAICSKILKIDQNNESASVMMADLSFQGVNKLEKLIFHSDKCSYINFCDSR